MTPKSCRFEACVRWCTVTTSLTLCAVLDFHSQLHSFSYSAIWVQWAFFFDKLRLSWFEELSFKLTNILCAVHGTIQAGSFVTLPSPPQSFSFNKFCGANRIGRHIYLTTPSPVFWQLMLGNVLLASSFWKAGTIYQNGQLAVLLYTYMMKSSSLCQERNSHHNGPIMIDL